MHAAADRVEPPIRAALERETRTALCETTGSGHVSLLVGSNLAVPRSQLLDNCVLCAILLQDFSDVIVLPGELLSSARRAVSVRS